MQYGNTFILLIILGCVAGSLISTWIRARYGYPVDDGMGNVVCKREQPGDATLQSMEATLAARDDRIAALEKRVRVLERIATDTRTTLADEIEALRA
jgi:hypothetical protein